MNDSQHDMGVPGLVVDGWRARRGGAAALRSRQRRRLAELVAFARARSPYFTERLAGLPGVVSDPVLLPVTSKPELMSRFNDWVTDREVTRQQVEDVVADPARIGELLLGRYTVATTSGRTGVRGIFVMDPGSLAVAAALSTRMLAEWLDPADVWRILRRRGRMAWPAAHRRPPAKWTLEVSGGLAMEPAIHAAHSTLESSHVSLNACGLTLDVLPPPRSRSVSLTPPDGRANIRRALRLILKSNDFWDQCEFTVRHCWAC